MAKLLTKDYYNKHPLEELSAARIAYTLLLEDQFEETAFRVMSDEGFVRRADAEVLREIEETEDIQTLLRYARKELPIDAKLLIRKRLMEREADALPKMRRMITTSALDSFIEHAVYFFTKCESDPVPWIMENYKAIRSPYARSMMCLVLGFRADVSVVPFLMKQVDYFEREFPDESFDQAPLIALQEIEERFRDV